VFLADVSASSFPPQAARARDAVIAATPSNRLIGYESIA
jgi:hypothetical protein